MRTSKIQNGRQGAPKWPTGSEKGSNLRLLGASINFRGISFLIQALLLWEKVATAEKNENFFAKMGEKSTKMGHSGHFRGMKRPNSVIFEVGSLAERSDPGPKKSSPQKFKSSQNWINSSPIGEIFGVQSGKQYTQYKQYTVQTVQQVPPIGEGPSGGGQGSDNNSNNSNITYYILHNT